MELIRIPLILSSIISISQSQPNPKGGPNANIPIPYNPLNSLDWDQLDILAQISSDFIGSDGFAEFRSYNGQGNNQINTHWGSRDAVVPRCLPAVYEDGYNSMTGTTRMNPREISNVLSRQLPEESDEFLNERFLTQFAWQWGQFIDHDITLISEDKSALDLDDDIDIYIPCGDPDFDDDDTCDAQKVMEVFRTKSFGTGTGPDPNGGPIDVRQQFNEITAFIDASMIYGSDAVRALNLRERSEGLMKLEGDGFLPKNTFEEENEPSDDTEFFIGGDVRVNEHLGLLTMHTIWVRAHNLLAERVYESWDNSNNAEVCDDWQNILDPNSANGAFYGNEDDCKDENVYQYTKLIINAIVQKIVFKDWLEVLFGRTAMAMFLGEYEGYNNTVNPGICPIFASAAYRLGHTFLPENLPLRNADCSAANLDTDFCPDCNPGGIPLKNTFFVPEVAEDTDGFLDALLNGYSCTLANEVDTFITGGVRNFLFFSSPEEFPGDLDLVAINLQRGREHGLPDYNSVRSQLGLGAHTHFDNITSNGLIAEQFEIMYQENIDDIDLFLGGLAEDHFDDGSFGETISSIVLSQFGRLRDGDRFFYQNYIKSGELMDFINCMTLKSIIELTTGITNIDSIDSIRHSIFRNQRAISIFAGTDMLSNIGDTFEAQAVAGNDIPINGQLPKGDINRIQFEKYHHHKEEEPNNKWYGINYNSNPQEPGTFVVQLTSFQIFMLFAASILVIGCTCYTFMQCKKNQNKKYFPVKYDTETDSEASDIQKLQK